MSQLKIGVVEDEILIADAICETLSSLGYQVAGPVISYTDAIEMIEEDRPDMLLLDIQLAGRADGIDLAAHVQNHYNIPYIFLTANSDKATVGRATSVQPYAFLVKPFTSNELFAAIEIAMANYQGRHTLATNNVQPSNSSFIFIKQNNAYHKLFLKNILYVQSVENYVVILAVDSRYIVRTTFQQFLAQFTPKQLYRLHRSYAINPAYLDMVNTDEVIIRGNKIPMHKAERKNLMDLIRQGLT